MNADLIIQASYFVAALLFILGLKRMSSPVTARSGIVVAGAGMVVAVLVSFLYTLDVNEAAREHLGTNVTLAIVALVLGITWAWRSGKSVAMTDMPQMVALYNGMGGGAAAAIAAIELFGFKTHGMVMLILAVLGGMIGAVSLTGSLVAWGKLDGRIKKAWRIKGLNLVNSGMLLVLFGLGAYMVMQDGHVSIALIAVFFTIAFIYGVFVTMPIGGADMPVVISLYNAFTGLAVGFEGYVLQNPALMIAGIVVGSAGSLLTLLMARAMNRSISNVLFSGFGTDEGAQSEGPSGTMKDMGPRDAGIAMAYSSKVIIIPGYGMAVAQAQHKLWEFVQLLMSRDVEVKFAIHPVAGRMPGHMNVLLAEAGVPYDMIFDLDEINEEFAMADYSLVIGANDVVNPAARSNKSSPIYGMPILNADQSANALVIKRGRGTGFSGIENELFFGDNTTMVFGDAQKVCAEMTSGVKEL